MNIDSSVQNVPHEPLPKLFWRFLKFGLLAWGGPVAQIAMIKHEIVDDEKWISNERFNRVLAVYQILPGPEAHELCVYFGMLSRGLLGALLAGLGFMLPGFILMFALSWFYVTYGINSLLFHAIFLGMQPAVAALIVHAVYLIGGPALKEDHWLWGIGLLAGIAQLLDLNFIIILLFAGTIYTLFKNKKPQFALGLSIGFTLWIAISKLGLASIPFIKIAIPTSSASINKPSLFAILLSGFRAGMLTFGSAYTAIPFLQHDAVQAGRWLTNAQFLDGLALSGLIPAPLIIFSTFIGYLAGGGWGAVLMTIGIFSPAFGFTMIGHDLIERIVDNPRVQAFLDGVMAGVVGLIAAAALGILNDTVNGIHAWVIFALALTAIFISKAKWSVAVIILAAGVYGLIFLRG